MHKKTENTGTIATLLVEDHQILREGVAALLSQTEGIEVVADVATAADAMAAVREGGIDVAVVDVQLDGEDGIALTRRLKYLQSDLHVLILSMFDDRATVNKALRAGASGYVLKGGGVTTLAAAIEAVNSGQQWLDPKLPGGAGAGGQAQADVPLSDREIGVLALVADGLTSAEIGQKLGLATKTVQNHRARIMEKLNIRSTAALVRWALEHGIG